MTLRSKTEQKPFKYQRETESFTELLPCCLDPTSEQFTLILDTNNNLQ